MSTIVFSFIQMKDEVSKIGNLDLDKELKHCVRRKPKGMAEMRVDIRVLVENQKHWHGTLITECTGIGTMQGASRGKSVK